MGYLKNLINRLKDKQYRNELYLFVLVNIFLILLGIIIGIFITSTTYKTGYFNCAEFVSHQCINAKDFINYSIS